MMTPCSYGIIVQKGYQTYGTVQGTVTTKLKGASVYRGNMTFMDGCAMAKREWIVYDVADFVIPPQASKDIY